jgi:hypothetical protein
MIDMVVYEINGLSRPESLKVCQVAKKKLKKFMAFSLASQQQPKDFEVKRK